MGNLRRLHFRAVLRALPRKLLPVSSWSPFVESESTSEQTPAQARIKVPRRPARLPRRRTIPDQAPAQIRVLHLEPHRPGDIVRGIPRQVPRKVLRVRTLDKTRTRLHRTVQAVTTLRVQRQEVLRMSRTTRQTTQQILGNPRVIPRLPKSRLQGLTRVLFRRAEVARESRVLSRSSWESYEKH